MGCWLTFSSSIPSRGTQRNIHIYTHIAYIDIFLNVKGVSLLVKPVADLSNLNSEHRQLSYKLTENSVHANNCWLQRYTKGIIIQAAVVDDNHESCQEQLSNNCGGQLAIILDRLKMGAA